MDENQVRDQQEDFVQEILDAIRRNLPQDELVEKLSDYHENDIATAFEELTPEERRTLYPILGAERVSEIFSYIDDPNEYLKELDLEKAARVIENMDSDDAIDVLEDLDDSTQEQIVRMMDEEAANDIRIIQSYDEDEIGSLMTTNFVEIQNTLSVRQAMRSLIEQAGKNDNISTIYVSKEDGTFYGAMDLKDLIIARDYTDLDSLISTSYPTLDAHEKTAECIDRIRDYAEDSLPVLNEDGRILGIITAQDIVEVVDDELAEDYAKLAGLTEEEDLHESLFRSMRKRLPWLVILLFLGMGISSVVGGFETVIAALPIAMAFQSLILSMAGNVGTQSLAVTIRVLMEEDLERGTRFFLMFKEMRVGFSNGLILGSLTAAFVGFYVHLAKGVPLNYAFMISACVGFSMMVAMTISSLVGTVVPMIFHKLNVDPAVASGPLITTFNDLVAVVTYYGMCWLLLINVLHLPERIHP